MTTAYITSKASSRTHPKLYGPIYFVLNTPFFNELAQFIALDAVPAIVDCPYLNHFNFGQVVGKHKVHYVIDLYWVAGFIWKTRMRVFPDGVFGRKLISSLHTDS
ncbi:hypothetical protein [Shewanella sp. 8A]|uniref:hypothetical protein n=1 Tax=Shewanella sp. 8A TaxID=2943323 RepID=UPI00201A7F39|nr:hypothetical protein [Shewanella sp. 8A]